MNLFKKYLIALFVTTLIFRAYVKMFTDVTNRYLKHWDATDTATLFVCMGTVSLLLLGGHQFLVWLKNARLLRLGRGLFLVSVALGLVNLAVDAFAGLNILSSGEFLRSHTKLLVAAMMAAFVSWLAWIRRRTLDPAAGMAHLCLMFSPMTALLLYQAFNWHTWGAAPEAPVVFESPGRKSNPVYVFVFDEWSYHRSVAAGKFREFLPNLRKFSRQAVMFNHAKSPSNNTYVSLPQFLFQTSDDFSVGADQAFFVGPDKKRLSTQQSRSLFGWAEDADYNTRLIGFYHSYRGLLGRQLDYCQSHPNRPKGNRIADRMNQDLARRLIGDSPYYHRMTNQYWVDLNHTVKRQTMECLKQATPNTFAVFHWPLPHAPYVFNPDGTVVDDLSSERLSMHNGMADDYLRHLKYLDRVVGELIVALKTSKQFDDALIVMTSDHSWRRDPDLLGLPDEEWKRHVPLLIKLPQQQSPRAIDDPISTNALEPLFRQVFNQQPNELEISALLQTLGLDRTTRIATPASPGGASRK